MHLYKGIHVIYIRWDHCCVKTGYGWMNHTKYYSILFPIYIIVSGGYSIWNACLKQVRDNTA